MQLNSGSYLFYNPSDQTVGQSISFTIENRPHGVVLIVGDLTDPPGWRIKQQIFGKYFCVKNQDTIIHFNVISKTCIVVLYHVC